MSAISGPTSPSAFAYYDPDSSSLKMSAGTFPWDSMPSSATLPASGSMRNGECFARPTLARAISGHDSSLLPSPSTSYAKGPSPNHGGTTAEAIRDLLPTPTVGDSKSAANRTAGREQDSQHHDGVTLTDAMRLLPTPRRGGDGGTAEHSDLSGVVDSLLPTPRATRGGSATETALLLPTPTTEPTTGNGHARNLGREAKMLPTPMARLGDNRGAQAKRYKNPERSNDLDDAIAWIGETTAPPSSVMSESSDERPRLL